MSELSFRNPMVLRVLTFAVILAVVLTIFHTTAPNYLSGKNLNSIFRHMSATGVAALGLCFVIIVAKYDLSFPGIAAFGGMTLGFMIASGYPIVPAIIVTIIGGCILGLINGVAIGYFDLPDIVTTIGVGSVAAGMSYLYSGGKTLSDNFFGSGILDINDSKFLGISAPIIVMLMLYLLAGIVLHATRFGRALYAVGENPTAAYFSGIRVRLLTMLAFVMCAVLSSWAIIMLTAERGRADPTSANNFLMPAYAAVFLGAALFGKASAPATFFGAMLISMIVNGMNLLTVPYYFRDAIISFILIVAIAVFEPRVSGALRRAGRRVFGRRPVEREA